MFSCYLLDHCLFYIVDVDFNFRLTFFTFFILPALFLYFPHTSGSLILCTILSHVHVHFFSSYSFSSHRKENSFLSHVQQQYEDHL